MKTLLTTKIGRLRIIAFLEGISLLVLLGAAVPLKYGFHRPELSYVMGRVHGVLFLLFVFNTISAGIEYQWKFRETTWKVLLACFVPFGTFYIDTRILKPIQRKEAAVN